MRVLSLDEIKQRELDILKAFVKICETEGYYYTLAYGTLIGAIRHKGFIPWDDDIDVFMPRDDYERLLENWQKHLGNTHLQLISPKNGGEVPFLKIVDRKCRVYSSNVSSRCHCNDYLWIDIFPVDGIKAGILKNVFCTLCVRGMNFLRNQVTLKMCNIPGCKFRKWSSVVYKTLFFWMPLNWFALIPDRIVASKNCRNSEMVGSFSRAGYIEKICFPARGFFIPHKVEFEGLMVNAPSNYDLILTKFYGDYLKLPPSNQREHHGIDVRIG